MITHRGDELERVAAQVPMGRITPQMLELLGIECVVLRSPDDLSHLDEGLRRYVERGQSVAFLTKKTFWTV
jgi:sulfopyruvate decarboxylase TPP-binding subunit